MKPSLLKKLALAAAMAVCGVSAQADKAPLRYELKPYTASSAEQQTQAGGQVVEMAGAPWVRLIFKEVKLQGQAKLRITSLQDGAQQHLDANSLRHWRNTSAYFNGSAVRIELLAPRGSKGNRYEIAQVMVGKADPAQPESQCGAVDDRVASAAANRARLLDVGCTANLMVNGCFVTAGHCLSTPRLVDVVEFDTPASNPDGTLNHPAPSKQYVPTANRKFLSGGPGLDWGVFTVAPNTETGLTPLQAQGAGLNLATSVPSVGQTVEITGYGVDSGTANQTQQVHSGPIVSVNTSATQLTYQTDTEGGNSGSVVLQGGKVVAIHTHGGCAVDGTGANSGTLYTNTAFQSAYATVCEGGGTPAPTCADVVRIAGSCSAAGKITATLTLSDASHDGQSVTMTLDGVPFDVPVKGSKAKLVAPGFSSGKHSVVLTEPASCKPAKSITCP